MPYQIVEFRDPLWRADYNYFAENGLASNNYNGAKYKFFATEEHEVESYARRGMTKVKKWVPLEPLRLLPMFNRPTRDYVYANMRPEGRAAMDVAFPVDAGGQVYRVSEETTTQYDYAFLDELCQMGIADGYIIPAQKARSGGVGAFHSEIGLCFAAFDSLKLNKIKTSAPPAVTKKQRNRNRNRSPPRRANNRTRTNNSSRRFPMFTNNNSPRRFPMFTNNNSPRRFPMFMNANNMPK